MKDLFLEMAYTRAVFKDHLEEKLIGAIIEFYKAECAVANGFKKWTEHWRNENKQLLQELLTVFLHSIRGFSDRRKALMNVVTYMQGSDNTYRRVAENQIARDFGRKLKYGVPAESTQRFYDSVNDLISLYEDHG